MFLSVSGPRCFFWCRLPYCDDLACRCVDLQSDSGPIDAYLISHTSRSSRSGLVTPSAAAVSGSPSLVTVQSAPRAGSSTSAAAAADRGVHSFSSGFGGGLFGDPAADDAAASLRMLTAAASGGTAARRLPPLVGVVATVDPHTRDVVHTSAAMHVEAAHAANVGKLVEPLTTTARGLEVRRGVSRHARTHRHTLVHTCRCTHMPHTMRDAVASAVCLRLVLWTRAVSDRASVVAGGPFRSHGDVQWTPGRLLGH